MQTRASPSRAQLTSLATAAGLPDASRLSKTGLFERLRSYNFDRLERLRARNAKRGRSSPDSARSKRRRAPRAVCPAPAPAENTPPAPTNQLDPITRAPLPADGRGCFDFRRPNGTVVRYDAATLQQYVLSTGDFSEPESRLPLREADLRRLDHAAGFPDRSGALDLFRHPERLHEQRSRRMAFTGLERCCGDLVVEMLRVVESFPREDGEAQLLMATMPAFADLFQQLHAVDAEGARMALAHFREYLHGPPNRPVQDPNGLLADVVLFIDSMEGGGRGAGAFGF